MAENTNVEENTKPTDPEESEDEDEPDFTVDSEGYHVKTGQFKVPKTSPVVAERGKKVPYPYRFKPVGNKEEAQAYIDAKYAEASEKKRDNWTLAGIINAIIERAAKGLEYQRMLAKHTPVELAENPQTALDKAIRNLQEAGFSEEEARQFVQEKFAAKSGK